MKNLDRNNLILLEIAKFWRLNPNISLCQMLRIAAESYPERENRYWHSGDLYYLEDTQLLKGLEIVNKSKRG
jgi:hypothetical protein